MRRFNWQFFWGLVLVVAGGLLLLQTTGVLAFNWDVLFGGAVALLGVLFGLTFLSDRRGNWWAVIPGVILLALAAGLEKDTLFPGLVCREGPCFDWDGVLILGGVSLSFWLVYFTDRQKWWALIPAGVVLTLALVDGVSAGGVGEWASGGIFFAGLGLTFLLVAGLAKQRWAFIPMGILLGLGVLLGLTQSAYAGFILGGLCIGAGVYWIYRTARAR